MLGHIPNPRGASRSVLLVFSILILLGSIGTTQASAYYSLTKQSQATVSPPPVELQQGTAENCTTTIYTSNTSAKVSVELTGAGATDVEDYVDNNSWDEDGVEKGTHSNFTAQQYGPDLINDTLTEGNTIVNYEYV